MFLFSSSMTWGVTDIGINGSSFYETPHIDDLARSGVNFKNSYSAHPVCYT